MSHREKYGLISLLDELNGLNKLNGSAEPVGREARSFVAQSLRKLVFLFAYLFAFFGEWIIARGNGQNKGKVWGH